MPPRLAALSPRACAWFALAVGVLVLGGVLKLTTDAGGPLWLDEGWTLGIVEQPTAAGFLQQLRLDVNPPLYFVLLRGWAGLFGDGNAALRALSTTAALLLPAAAFLPGAGMPRDRLTWAALLALWPQGTDFAQEARGYALLALLAAVQTVLFAHLLSAPDRRRAALWVTSAAATALTQHHALILTATQGVALLAVERGRVARLWPAALLFAPALTWDIVQAQRIAVFGRPEHAWYFPFGVHMAKLAVEVMLGPWLPASAITALALAAAALSPRPKLQRRDRPEEALRAAAAASIAGGLLLIVLGALRPSLTQRYLAPFAPGALLVPGLLLRRASSGAGETARAGVIVTAAVAALATAAGSDNRSRRAYQFETASADLARAGVKRLAFLWDNPTDGALTPAERAALADAFFARAHRPVRVEGVLLQRGDDPNARFVAKPADGLLWLYDLRVPHTAAARFPPRLEDADPRLACRRYAGGALGVVACVRKPFRWTR